VPLPLHFEQPRSIPFPSEESAADDEEEDESTGFAPWTYFRIGLAVFLIIILVATYIANNPSSSTIPTPSSPSGPPGPVTVSVILVNSPDNACGLNGANAGGYNSPGFGGHSIFWWLPMSGAALPCTVSSVTTSTPGFSVSSTLPTTVSSDQTPIEVTVYAPAAYNGTLTLTFD
jgi:hypothetical protein